MKLTKRAIDALEPVTGTDFFVWDDDLPGFGVRVWPSGRKTYVAQYRSGRETRRLKLGTHGPMTVDEARRQAKINLGDVARGEDPSLEKKTRRASITVKELCERYLEACDKGLVMGKGRRPKKASTLVTDRGRIARHIVPLIGSKLVIDLTRADVTKFLRDVQTGKTAADVKTRKRGRAIVEGGAGTATRTTGLLQGILTYAVSEGIIEANPAHGVKRPADNKRERRLTPAGYAALGQALRDAEDEGESWQLVAIVRVLALTGCRLSEVAGLEWSEVDRDARLLKLGDTKTGKSTRPFGRAVLDILATTKPRKGSIYVFPPARGTGDHFKGVGKGIERITKRAGLEGVTAHVLRHSFSSECDDLGYTEATRKTLMGHSRNTVSQGYVHKTDEALVAAADKVSAHIAALMGGNPETSAGNDQNRGEQGERGEQATVIPSKSRG